MSSIAQVCRGSARALRRQATQNTRCFSTTPSQFAASNFTMPALSPTMTEGNIATWKMKEGDSFVAGDVILEIETDKATMDVEAQDDGILAKILQQDGAKGVKVGSRIAVLAEEGDDISSLEIPAEDAASSSAPKQEKPAPEPRKEAKPSSDTSSDKAPSSESSKSLSSSSSSPASPTSSSSSGKPANKKYPLYPSVALLIANANISSSDAAKIPASGPAGRLLKGDVLAYLGRIAKDYSSSQSARLDALGKLDLSNIKIRAPPAPKAANKPAAAAAKPVEDLPTEIAVSISLAAVFATQKRIQESLGLTLPLSTFIARASEIANDDLPRSKTDSQSADALFDAVLGLDKVPGHGTSRGHYIPQITALPPAGVASSLGLAKARRAVGGKVDVIDLLAGSVKKSSGGVKASVIGGSVGAAGATNVFSVPAKKGEEKRVRTYLERVKTVLEVEPGRCVL